MAEEEEEAVGVGVVLAAKDKLVTERGLGRPEISSDVATGGGGPDAAVGTDVGGGTGGGGGGGVGSGAGGGVVEEGKTKPEKPVELVWTAGVVVAVTLVTTAALLFKNGKSLVPNIPIRRNV